VQRVCTQCYSEHKKSRQSDEQTLHDFLVWQTRRNAARNAQ
jgi:hypothetical protein